MVRADTMDKDTTKTWLIPPTQVMYESLAEEDVKPKKRQSDWEIGECSLCGRYALWLYSNKL